MSNYYDVTKLLESLWQGILNFDHLNWEMNKNCSIIEYLQHENGVSEDMLRETFFGMTNSESAIKDEVSYALLDVKAILHRATQMPEFSSLRKSTNGDNTASLIAVGAFYKDLYDKLPAEVKEELENAKNAKEEMRDINQYLQALQEINSREQEYSAGRMNSDPQNSIRHADNEHNNSAGRMDEELLNSASRKAQSQLGAARNFYDQAIAKLESALTEKAANISYAIATSSKNTTKKLDDVKNLKAGLSWGDENSGAPIKTEELDSLLELAKFLEDNGFSRLIDMLGKCEKMAESFLESDLHGRDELVDYKIAPFDLEGLAPDELLSLADDSDGPLMFDLLSRLDSTLHSQYEGKEPTAKGPLIFVEDVSGSTKGEVFSLLSAINFTLIKSSAKQNREYANIPFSGPGQFHVYRPGNNPDLKVILSHLNSGYFQGTEPYAPLLKAIQIIQEDPSMKKASILFGTDGVIAPPPQEFIEKLADLKEKRVLDIYALLIGTNQSAVSFATKVIYLCASSSINKELFEILEPIL